MSTTTLPELEDPEPDMLRAAERSTRVTTDTVETSVEDGQIFAA